MRVGSGRCLHVHVNLSGKWKHSVSGFMYWKTRNKEEKATLQIQVPFFKHPYRLPYHPVVIGGRTVQN